MPAATVYGLERGEWKVVLGVRRWVPEPDPVLAIPHGTDAGYYRHRRLKDDPCEDCTAAHAAENARRTGAKTVRGRKRHRAVCGTESGHRKHRREGQPVCDDCKAAHAAATARRRARSKEESNQNRRAA